MVSVEYEIRGARMGHMCVLPKAFSPIAKGLSTVIMMISGVSEAMDISNIRYDMMGQVGTPNQNEK